MGSFFLPSFARVATPAKPARFKLLPAPSHLPYFSSQISRTDFSSFAFYQNTDHFKRCNIQTRSLGSSTLLPTLTSPPPALPLYRTTPTIIPWLQLSCSKSPFAGVTTRRTCPAPICFSSSQFGSSSVFPSSSPTLATSGEHAVIRKE